MLPGEVDGQLWQRCSAPDCGAARSEPADTCLAHLDSAELDRQLARFGRGRALDGRGLTVGAELLERILQAAPVDGVGRRKLSGARFDGAAFQSEAVLDDAWFGHDASFRGASFGASVSFRNARVLREAGFAQAVFEGEARFDGARLEGPAAFNSARFRQGASFAGTTFGGPAWFTGATFEGDALFRDATFARHASFQGVELSGKSDFAASIFEADAEFTDARFAQPGDFAGSSFKGRDGVPEVAARADVSWWGPPLATWRQRALAALWDAAGPLGILMGSVLAAAFLRFLGHDQASTLLLWLAPLAALAFVLHNAWVQGETGQSIGKRRWGLRLLDERDRRPPGAWRSVARQVLHLVDTVTLVGWLLPLRNGKAQTIADRIMGTVVVVVGERWHQANRDEPRSVARAASFG